MGVTMVLLAVWLGPEIDSVIGELGAWLMVIALLAPFLVKYLQAWGTMLRGPKNQQRASE